MRGVYPRRVPSLQVIEEGVLIACFYWVAKEVFAASITECDELAVSLDTLGADRSDVVADAFSNFPLGEKTRASRLPRISIQTQLKEKRIWL